MKAILQVLILLSVVLTSVSAQVMSITNKYVLDDSFVFGTAYNLNGARTDPLRVGGWGDFNFISLVKKLNGIPGSISKATLMLVGKQDQADKIVIDIWSVNNSWIYTKKIPADEIWANLITEADLSWIVGYRVPYPGYYYIPADVTTSVRNWVNAKDAYAFFLISPREPDFSVSNPSQMLQNQWMSFFSTRQPVGAQELRPYLEVVWNAPAVRNPFKINFPAEGYNSRETSVTSILDLDEARGRIKILNNQSASKFLWRETVGGVNLDYYEKGPSDPEPSASFRYPFKYSGTARSFNGQVSLNVLSYDNHNGYDYFFSNKTPKFIAPEAGFVYVGSDYTKPGTYSDQTGFTKLWRHPSLKIPKDKVGTWKSNHSIYINHGNGYITVVAHCSSLESGVRTQIETSGFAIIKRGERIGTVGNYGASTANHLHFEVRKSDPPNIPIDPYDNSTPLWYSGQ